MLPNRYVIIWDSLPVGLGEYNAIPYKTDDPQKVHYWAVRGDAESYLDRQQFRGIPNIRLNAEVKEIQFRIVG
jgi:hypothetical protein